MAWSGKERHWTATEKQLKIDISWMISGATVKISTIA